MEEFKLGKLNIKFMNREVVKHSVFSGVIGAVCGLIAVTLVHLAGVQFTTFKQASMAVIIASFFSAFFATYFVLKRIRGKNEGRK